jgi:7 transmembrane receptor (rhodopsin family)
MTFLAVVIAWLIGGFYSFLLSFLTSTIVNGECIWGVVWSSDTSKSTYAITTFVIFFALILVSFLFCYGRIIKSLRQQARVFALQHSNNPLAKANNLQALRIQMNAVKTMIIVSAAFVVCWLPCDVTSTVYVIYDGSSLLSQIYYVTLFVAICNICLNPFIYATKYDTVKYYLLRLVYRRKNELPTISIIQLHSTMRQESKTYTI